MMPSSKGNPFITDHVARSAIQTLVERCDALEARVKALEAKQAVGLIPHSPPVTVKLPPVENLGWPHTTICPPTIGGPSPVTEKIRRKKA